MSKTVSGKLSHILDETSKTKIGQQKSDEKLGSRKRAYDAEYEQNSIEDGMHTPPRKQITMLLKNTSVPAHAENSECNSTSPSASKRRRQQRMQQVKTTGLAYHLTRRLNRERARRNIEEHIQNKSELEKSKNLSDQLIVQVLSVGASNSLNVALCLILLGGDTAFESKFPPLQFPRKAPDEIINWYETVHASSSLVDARNICILIARGLNSLYSLNIGSLYAIPSFSVHVYLEAFTSDARPVSSDSGAVSHKPVVPCVVVEHDFQPLAPEYVNSLIAGHFQ